jgi:hypothetical protein
MVRRGSTVRVRQRASGNRDWQWIKHLILAMKPWSVIVGKGPRSIFVVDACAETSEATSRRPRTDIGIDVSTTA